MDGLLRSCICTQAQMESAAFRSWVEKLRPSWDRLTGLRTHLHRKLWEWCYIAQALKERDMLRPGRRGLGFGVGQEPLAALFAGLGCDIVATDLAEDRARQIGWIDSHQHAASLDALNADRLCQPEAFARRVSFRFVDMNDIPTDLRGFDFVWSACSLEHLGSLEHGRRFLHNSMTCLKPGGVGVHTTEFNLSSNEATLDHFPTVLFRRRDIESLAERLTADGHALDVDFARGDGIADDFVDVPPYRHDPHLRLQVLGYVTTSMGLIVAAGRPSWKTHCLRLLRQTPWTRRLGRLVKRAIRKTA
jgi:2-polyprenyl-3-methyl-5-hydroxy-6-metoxy-1,4-benzoquinol methylase